LKSNKQIQKEFYKLRESEIENLKLTRSEIDNFIKRNKVDEEGLRILNNITTTLGSFKESYLSRLLKFLKLGHMVD
tara:strand:- start:106 stop:333 length:228 start_codon:yes stop_codon:yes gene_type:complete